MFKLSFLLLLLNLLFQQSFSQQKEFEGIINYKVDVHSKAPGYSDKVMKGIVAKGDVLTSYIKDGNYRESSGGHELFFINANQRAYFKFRNVDTLYFLDYLSDTDTVLSVTKLPDEQSFAKFSCKAIEVKLNGRSTKYFYAPSLYINPEHDKNNKLGGYNAFIKEAAAVWLSSKEEADIYSLTISATSVEQKAIDISVFNLPNLPQKMFSLETVLKAPEYTRSGGWEKYLQKFTNTELGAKYIKTPKGESGATQSVLVSFLITENGEVQNVKVENPKAVHSKLAEEAVRVVTESGRWKPGTIYGEKMPQYLKQSITFSVSK